MRPTTYTEEMLAKCYEYIEECPDYVPSIVGLCRYIQRSKSIVYDWEKDPEKKEFSDILKQVNEMQEFKLINGGLANELNPTLSKMMLSKHGHVEIKQVDNTSSDGSMTPTKLVRTVIDPKDADRNKDT